MLPQLLDDLERDFPSGLDAQTWIAGRYKPTPTIIEAARHLYANHSVADIVRTEADERNLSDTARRVETLDPACAGKQARRSSASSPACLAPARRWLG